MVGYNLSSPPGRFSLLVRDGKGKEASLNTAREKAPFIRYPNAAASVGESNPCRVIDAGKIIAMVSVILAVLEGNGISTI